MIISEKHKYIFIGLPFSASSAISKELIEQYEGEYILNKHSNIQSFLAEKNIKKIENYTVFAVYRDLEEILFTRYNKFKYNSNNVYTDPSFLVENGGHITKKALNIYFKITNENISFEEYVVKFSNKIPYDFVFSGNAPFLTDVLFFNNLSADFDQTMEKLGFKNRRPLPLYNKTERKDEKPILSERTTNRFINPYKNKVAKFISSEEVFKTSILNQLLYNFFHIVKKYKWNRDDKNRSDKRDSYFSNIAKK